MHDPNCLCPDCGNRSPFERQAAEWLHRALTAEAELEALKASIADEQLPEAPDLKYSISIQYSEEDKAFIAEVPELPGCIADGPTPDKALTAVRQVAALWLEAGRELGRPIPEPRTRKYRRPLDLR